MVRLTENKLRMLAGLVISSFNEQAVIDNRKKLRNIQVHVSFYNNKINTLDERFVLVIRFESSQYRTLFFDGDMYFFTLEDRTDIDNVLILSSDKTISEDSIKEIMYDYFL